MKSGGREGNAQSQQTPGTQWRSRGPRQRLATALPRFPRTSAPTLCRAERYVVHGGAGSVSTHRRDGRRRSRCLRNCRRRSSRSSPSKPSCRPSRKSKMRASASGKTHRRRQRTRFPLSSRYDDSMWMQPSNSHNNSAHHARSRRPNLGEGTNTDIQTRPHIPGQDRGGRYKRTGKWFNWS